MKRIDIYDEDMETINEWCEANGNVSPAEFIMELLDVFREENEESKHR